MKTHVLEVLVPTAVATAVAAPPVRVWLQSRQSIDHPNERSSHVVPTPRGGGLACAVGAAIGSLAASAGGQPPSSSWVGAITALGAVGRVDDVADLPAVPRLGAQVLSGAIVGAKAGGLIGSAAGAFAVPAIVNAFNFMDGINGISGGTAIAWGLCVATDVEQDIGVHTQGHIVAGIGLGFLPYNVPSASMFLGDVGSYLIGSGIAVTVIESAVSDGKFCPKAVIRTLAPLIPYLADTGSTMIKRFLRGGSLTVAHREHAYQKLVQETGWDHWKVAGLSASCAVICGLASRSKASSVVIIPVVAGYLGAPSIARRLRLRS